MRRIWSLFGDGKKQKEKTTREEGSDGDDENVEVTNTPTQTTPGSREEVRDQPATTPEASTPVRDEKSVDEGAKRKSKKNRKKLSRSSEARTPKRKSAGSVGARKRSREAIKERNREPEKKDEDGGKQVVVAEAREIAAREDNEEFENDGGAMAKSKIKTRDLKWIDQTKEETSSEERKKKEAVTPVKKKVAEAREDNKADDEEFENDGKAALAKSKIKTRDLKWKSEESPQKVEHTAEDTSQPKAPRKKKVAEAREENKADDEEFENEGKGAMAKSKIKTRDLKWMGKDHPLTDSSPSKTFSRSGSDSGGESSEKKQPRKKQSIAKPKVAEAREENKADDEEFENDGKAALAKSKIKTRDLKWKEEEKEAPKEAPKEKERPKKPVMAEAREENKADDEEFENGSGGTMARSKIKTRDLKWKKDEEASTPARSMESTVDTSEARSPAPKIVEARDENKADDEEFENDGKATMAKSKIKTRDLKWIKEEKTSPAPAAHAAPAATPPAAERKEQQKTVTSPDPPTRSFMQMLLPEKKKEQTARSLMLPPTSPASPSPSTTPPPLPPLQSTQRLEVKETKVEKVDRSATRSRHRKERKEEGASHESTDKSFMRNLRPRINLSRKSKSRHDKSAIRELPKQPEKSPCDSTSPSQVSQASAADKSSRERSSLRLDAAASAVDKSVKSIKSMFKKTDDTKKKMEDLLPRVERDARDVQEARRLMEMLKRNNVFENALFPYQNESLRAHFTSGSRKLEKSTMDLLFKAADFVLDKILYRGEELDEYIDNPLKTFILNRTKSRTMVVEHLLKHPEFLPQTWGGRTVVLMRSEEEVSVAPEDEKSKKETRSKKEDGKK